MADRLWKPQLAAKPEPEELDAVLAGLKYPLLGSVKFDGVRAEVQNGVLLSRNLTPIINLEMQQLWGHKQFNGLDGEIIVGDPTAEDCFNISSGIARSRNKSAKGALFHIFDSYCGVEPYEIRLSNASLTCDQKGYTNLQGLVSDTERFLRPIKSELLKNLKQLLAYEARALKAGHEGIMLRDPNGGYKQGRSTLREGGLIAVKRFVDAEAVVLDTYEQEENTNAQVENALGKMKRSTHQAGKVGKGTLGGFTVCMLVKARASFNLSTVSKESQFNIGTGVGLTDAVRKELWLRRKSLVGRLIKFRYQKVGTMTRPRQPIFLGFRDKGDM